MKPPRPASKPAALRSRYSSCLPDPHEESTRATRRCPCQFGQRWRGAGERWPAERRPRQPSNYQLSTHQLSTPLLFCFSCSTDVIMPQMGESIAEGTITRWMKKVGDTVKRDEPIFEISTDKVDAEIPSPAAGALLEIKVPEGQTVAINTVVARIGEAGEQPARPPPRPGGTPGRGEGSGGRSSRAGARNASPLRPPTPRNHETRRTGPRGAPAPRPAAGRLPRRPPEPLRPKAARSSPSRIGSAGSPPRSFARSPPSTPWTSRSSTGPGSTTA